MDIGTGIATGMGTFGTAIGTAMTIRAYFNSKAPQTTAPTENAISILLNSLNDTINTIEGLIIKLSDKMDEAHKKETENHAQNFRTHKSARQSADILKTLPGQLDKIEETGVESGKDIYKIKTGLGINS